MPLPKVPEFRHVGIIDAFQAKDDVLGRDGLSIRPAGILMEAVGVGETVVGQLPCCTQVAPDVGGVDGFRVVFHYLVVQWSYGDHVAIGGFG